MVQEDVQAIVLDNGSSTCKIGFAGDDAPRGVFPSMVGLPKYPTGMVTNRCMGDLFVGDDAYSKRGVLTLKRPFKDGLVDDWHDMEKIWRHAFYTELRVDPFEHPVLISEPFLNPKGNRERMTQMLFETFNVPAMFGSTGGMLSLLASGRTTGCVVECGDGVAHVAPVHEGYIERRAVVRVAVGGADVTEHMRLLLGEQGYYPSTTAEMETVRHMKETMTYVAVDVHTERKIPFTSMDKPYTLPDGTVIYLGSERFRCPEVLFDPMLIGKEAPGIHECAVEAIRKCDAMYQTDLYRNIVLSGGGTLFPGLRERLSNEMIVSPLVPGNLESEVRVVAPPERKYTAWIGGSILASLSTFESMWISKAEYDESGTSIIHRKCFL